jgi:hypothetical protein
MSETEAVQYFGKRGPDIVRISRDVVSDGRSSYRPKGVDPERAEAALKRYGANAVAVLLLLQTWMEVRWREHEGEPTPWDTYVVRLHHWTEVTDLPESPVWRSALLVAGYRSEDPMLNLVWHDASAVGEKVGEHGGRWLASAMAGELAQIPRGADLHFFLDMFPWVRAGHWPCGWSDQQNRVVVF